MIPIQAAYLLLVASPSLATSGAGPCDTTLGTVLLTRHALRSLGEGQPDARIMLALRGKGLNTTSVELCIFVSNQVAYRQLWSAAGWASDETRPAGPTSRQRSLRGDSLVRSAVDTVIQTSFTPFRFESEDPTQGWDSDFQNPFAPIAYTLKQYDYRAAHRLPLAIQLPHVPMEDGSTPGVSLPARVCDSLYRAPVDSQTVRSLVQRLAGEHAPTFSFSLGGELLVEIVWDRLSRRFLLARG